MKLSLLVGSVTKYSTQAVLASMVTIIVVLFLGYNYIAWQANAAVWEEPTCNPATDPSTCNIAPPINTSSIDQTKAGGITIEGDFALDDGTTLATNGSLSLPLDSIIDTMVSDDITARSFTRQETGGTLAVDLDSWSSSIAPGVEVVGSLPAGAITDNWVDETGDEHVTGYLYVDPSNSNTVTPDPDDAITIETGTSPSGRGIYILNNSTTFANAGIEIDVQSAQSGIKIDHSATNGIGLWVSAVGTSSYGVIASGTDTGVSGFVGPSGSVGGVGVRGESYQGYGISGISRETNSAGVYGQGTASGTIGVFGESSTDYGVDANTTSSGNPGLPYYGVRGCKNSINCGYLGGEHYAVKAEGDADIQGRTFVQDTIERTQPTTNTLTNSIGKIRTRRFVDATKPNHLPWQDNVTEMLSDGDELWVLNSNTAPASNLTRIDTQTGQTNAVSDFTGGLGFQGLTVNENGAYSFLTAGGSVGDLYHWPKRQQGSPTNTTTLVGPSGISDIVEVTHYNRPTILPPTDPTRLIVGRKQAASPQLIHIVDPSTAANIAVTGLPIGNEVLKLVVDNNDRIIALVEVKGLYGGGITHQVWIIDGSTGAFIQLFDLVDSGDPHFVADMVYDGKYVWLTGDGSGAAGNDGLWRLDSGIGQLQYMGMQLYQPIFEDPAAIEFDGQYLWVGLYSSSSLVRVLPYAENGSSLFVEDNEEYYIEEDAYILEFDGKHLWAMTKYPPSKQPLLQITTGNTYGNTSSTVQGGINMFSRSNAGGSFVDPVPVCVYVDWNGSAYVLRVDQNVCPGG